MRLDKLQAKAADVAIQVMRRREALATYVTDATPGGVKLRMAFVRRVVDDEAATNLLSDDAIGYATEADILAAGITPEQGDRVQRELQGLQAGEIAEYTVERWEALGDGGLVRFYLRG